ncbi:MAG: hypothetical protein JKY37_03310 [Nannocystaceae bacterium]|nr:hypothetical protein [Nannocystaceae bacterium]
MTTIKRASLIGALASLAIASGCVTTEPSAIHQPWTQTTYTGFASHSGATVELYAFSQATNAWEAVPDTTTTASTTSTTYGGRTVYAWNLQSTLLETAADQCRVSSSCSYGAEGTIRIQFREVGGDYNPLLTFDDGGVSCVLSAVNNDGEDLYGAAWNCKASIFDELRINVIL